MTPTSSQPTSNPPSGRSRATAVAFAIALLAGLPAVEAKPITAGCLAAALARAQGPDQVSEQDLEKTAKQEQDRNDFAQLEASKEEAAKQLEVEIVNLSGPQIDAGEISAEGISDARLSDWSGILPPPNYLLAQRSVREREPNDTFATATPLGGTNVVAFGSNPVPNPNNDLDFWSFTANAGDRVYAATQTSWSANSIDTVLDLIASDGTTILENDDNDGALGSTASSIAGKLIPANGTYYLKVRNNFTTSGLRPYLLHLRVQSGAPVAEIEPNNSAATATVLPASGWASGIKDPTTDVDYFSFTANAGDTVFVSLDADPERDGPGVPFWNPRLGIALFGDIGNQILVVDDASVGSAANPLSEAHFMTVKTTGTYYAYVDTATAAGGPTFTYHLSVSVHPATPNGINCTTYTSTDVPKTIPAAGGLVSSVITVPGNPRIEDINVEIVLNHLLMGDIDAHLRSPAGNDNGLFTDVGALAVGGQTQMDTGFDDDAGIPPVFTIMKGPIYQPELSYRMAWFKGENAGGTWTLDLYDDLNNANGGTLTSWAITICEPPPVPSCGGSPVTVYSSDFEADGGGFTHSGTVDEWERGLPSFAPITTCNSGTNCWKTDLDNQYGPGACDQVLVSPPINLSGFGNPIRLNWAQRYQFESAVFDWGSVEVREVGDPANSKLVFQHLDATMRESVSTPALTIEESAGWGLLSADLDSFAGKTIEIRFRVVCDTSVFFAGYAIDDVAVTASLACSDADLCTQDICDPATGNCSHPPIPPCNDNNACTDDTCNPATGCVFTPNNNTCNDNNVCTQTDGCLNGSCQGSNPLNCNDNNSCTDDGCDASTGCTFTANNANTCSDGNGCTIDVCNAGVCGCPSCPGPTTRFTSTDVPKPISSTGTPTVTSTLVVSGVNTYLFELQLKTFITHTFNQDLDFTLMSPQGTVATISTDNGGTFDNVFNGTVWFDRANPAGQVPYTANQGLVGDATYTNLVTQTPLVSEEGLGAFVGENPNGTWTLTINDDTSIDGGSLDGWSLDVTTTVEAPTETTTTIASTDVPRTIVDNTVVTSTLAASGLGNKLGTLKMTTFITHTFNSDLDITLRSPAGTVVTVTSDNGSSFNDVYNGTVWFDKANPAGQVPYVNNNGVVSDHLYVDLTLASPLTPEEGFGAFRNEDPNGTWLLSISDDAGGDTGNLANWSLEFTTIDCNFNCTQGCDDNNLCTIDSCNQATGCVHDPVQCTPLDQCHLAGTCDTATGVCSNPNAPDNTQCNDGNACTTNDVCTNGVCGGNAANCDDSNPCTDDGCNASGGCTHSNNTNSCNDNNACTTNDTCANGSCVGGAPPNCDDSNVCTNDGCNTATGCTHANNSNSCSDNNTCTTNDTCSNGSCAGGAPLNCDDANVCTNDSCAPATGCAHSNNTNPCDDGNSCTNNDTCSNGVCGGGGSCTAPVAGAVLTPVAPRPPAPPSSICHPPSTRRFTVGCSASSACDPSPQTSAVLHVVDHVVPQRDGACVERNFDIPVACGEVIEIRLAAPPCPAKPPRSSGNPVETNPDGTRTVTGESVVLIVTATDSCGQSDTDSYDPSAEPSPLCDEVLLDGTCCPAIGSPADPRCRVPLCPRGLLAPAPGESLTGSEAGGRSR